MKTRLLIVALLAGCGRISFDPLDPGVGSGGDGGAIVDASPNAVVDHGAGGLNTCVLLGSGDVWCWGAAEANGNGDTTTNTGVPQRIATTTPIVALETSDAGACGLIGDHRALCWGRNDLGQLGVGTVGVVGTPRLVVGETTIAEISVGYYAACLRRRDGSIACSGKANLLGTNAPSDSATFKTVPELGPALGITSGDQHTCVLLATGAVTCWGDNVSFQLGTGTQTSSTLPVAGPSGPYIKIAAGDAHTCALRASGTVDCWGRGTSGELGDGTMVSRGTAASVMNLTDAVEIVGLAQSTCALRATGRVACWGLNAQGAVGDGTTNGVYVVPFELPLANVSHISARTSRHVCASQNGVLSCWGGNSNGQLGRGAVGGNFGTPSAVIGLPTP